MRNIFVEKINHTPIEQQRVEMVEHKGVGHPDTICDAVCEESSIALSKYYLDNFGHIFHHNLDKALLVAGKSVPHFGGGKIIEQVKIIICGRAIDDIQGKLVPVDEICLKAARNHIHSNIIALEEGHVDISTQISTGAGNLQEVFRKTKQIPLANDTSFGVGFAPFSKTESIVLKTAKLINSEEFRKRIPAAGEDIKVMGYRNGEEIDLTVCMALIDKHIGSMEEYRSTRQNIINQLKNFINLNSELKTNLFFNTLDDPNGTVEADIYLTVTGLSAEMGDDGQVGRGNRANGLITPSRNMSLEAPAGKNPVSHTGKIYNVLAQLIANDVVKETNVKEVYVKLLSQIGSTIDQPLVASIQLIEDVDDRTKEIIQNIADSWLENVQKVTTKILNKEVTVY